MRKSIFRVTLTKPRRGAVDEPALPKGPPREVEDPVVLIDLGTGVSSVNACLHQFTIAKNEAQISILPTSLLFLRPSCSGRFDG
jgi:hypothetical protein